MSANSFCAGPLYVKAPWLGLAPGGVSKMAREESRQISGVEELASEETSYAPLCERVLSPMSKIVVVLP